MAIRKYDFVSGFETETLPTSGDPSGDSDLINKGYADLNYTSRYEIIGTAATATAVRAYTAAQLSTASTKQLVFRLDNSAFYVFDHDDVQADDGDLILRPAHNPASGRWLKTAVFASAADARVDVLYQFIIGTALQVSAGEATHSSFSSAQTAASDGDRITWLIGTFVENITVTKKLKLDGLGHGTVLDGTVTFTNTSLYSSLKDVKVTGDITLDSGADGIFIKEVWLSAGSTLVDNGNGNLLEAIVE